MKNIIIHFQKTRMVGCEGFLLLTLLGLGKWVSRQYELHPFKRLSLDDIDVILRCQLQRRRHFIRRLFAEADCQKKGNVTKAALLQIFHNLCPEMQMYQFHRLCERYCLNETPTLSFNEFEAIFGVPPVGRTRAPKPKSVFGYDHKLSVAFAFEAILRGASSKRFDLKELLPPSCFDVDGRILKPQLREMLARMRVNLTDENFRRLWEQKFDLEGIGSIATRQLIDQLGLTEEGTPRKDTIQSIGYKFPPAHRTRYKNYNGYKSIRNVNQCPPMTIDPVSQPLLRNERPVDSKLSEICKAKDAQPAVEECIPFIELHYKDQMNLLRQRRPCFRNPIEQLQYIFDEPRMALGLVFQSADSECRGYISIMHLLAIFRDIGLKVDLEEVKRYAKRQGLFVDSDRDLCGSNEKDVAYKQLLRRLECVPPPRTPDDMKMGGSCASKKGFGKIRHLEDELFRTIFHDYFDFIEKLEKHDKDGGVPLAYFRDLVESTIGFTMDRCQWEDLVRRIRLKNECRVDLNHFLSYISKECKNPPYRAPKAGDMVHDPELKSLVQFSGEPRGLSHLLLAIQKLINEKFAVIDKIYKHFDHVGHATIDKHDFGVIMKKVGLEMCEVELDSVWRLVNEAEPSANGLHKYHQVMRFFLETGNIRHHLATAERNKRLHDSNLLKMKDFRQCQNDFKKRYIDDTLALGKTASEIKYMERQKTKPSEERVNELCKKIRSFVITIWTDLRNGFLWQDPFGWGSMLRKDFRKVCEAFSFPLDSNELYELAHGLDKHNNGHVNYVDFLSRFSEGHIPPKVGQKFDIVHHKLKNLKDGSETGVREVMDRIRRICLREYKTLLAGFRAIASPTHPNFFNEKDLGDFLRKHGMDFSPDCLYHLRTAYDQHRRGCINYTDFLQQTMDVTRPLE
uniref:EF hand calcium binding domain containing protein n=1 Tax=Echinococcus granulosus TaxID=6210 RepID=A0A068WNY0_ECHGR|nr:EF hand calcium binding domain containing protein [Echinococcus granulosus]